MRLQKRGRCDMSRAARSAGVQRPFACQPAPAGDARTSRVSGGRVTIINPNFTKATNEEDGLACAN